MNGELSAQWQIKNNEKICGIDIDGVLNYYPQCWIDFVNSETGKRFGYLDDVKEALSYNEYRRLKNKYRESGYKENLEVRVGAAELTNFLRSAGFKIVVLTARPFDKHSSLMGQTVNWLNKNDIKFDSIIQGEDKHAQIVLKFPHLKFMIEDDGFIANTVAKWGYKVFLLNNQYNLSREKEVHQNVIRVKSLLAIMENVRECERI